ncbi:MAG: hypothetical protein WC860_02675 [Candidatus Margulisiibacteriota bacterium]
MYFLTELKSENISLFQAYMPEAYHIYLKKKIDYPASKLVVVGVGILSEIVGVILALPNKQDINIFDVVLFLVKKKYIALGIEPKLLDFAEEKIKKYGAERIRLYFKIIHKDNEQYLYYESFFKKINYPEPILKSTKFFIKDKQILNESWFTLKIPSGYKFIKLGKLNKAEKQLLYETSKINDNYQQLLKLSEIESKTSLGIKEIETNKIIGWMANEINDVYLKFAQLYLAPNYRNKGLFFSLLSNSIALAFEHFSQAIFVVAAKDQKVKRVHFRLMGHLCDNIVETYYSEKVLNKEI